MRLLCCLTLLVKREVWWYESVVSCLAIAEITRWSPWPMLATAAPAQPSRILGGANRHQLRRRERRGRGMLLSVHSHPAVVEGDVCALGRHGQLGLAPIQIAVQQLSLARWLGCINHLVV